LFAVQVAPVPNFPVRRIAI